MEKFEVLNSEVTNGDRYKNMSIKPKSRYSVITNDGLLICEIPDHFRNQRSIAELIVSSLNKNCGENADLIAKVIFEV